jgi:hypothetical protein
MRLWTRHHSERTAGIAEEHETDCPRLLQRSVKDSGFCVLDALAPPEASSQSGLHSWYQAAQAPMPQRRISYIMATKCR